MNKLSEDLVLTEILLQDLKQVVHAKRSKYIIDLKKCCKNGPKMSVCGHKGLKIEISQRGLCDEHVL